MTLSNFFSLGVFIISFLGLCLCICLIIYFVNKYKKITKERKRVEELKKERMERLEIIAQRMSSVFANNHAIQKSFESFSGVSGFFAANISKGLYNKFFNDDNPLSGMIAEQKQKYQKFFDQFLKIYAEKLKTAYDNEENFKRDNAQLEHDSMSGEEIRNFLKRKRFFSEEKKKAEEDCWDLHDALRDLGFDVFAEKSDGVGYKAYLYLKKSYPF